MIDASYSPTYIFRVRKCNYFVISVPVTHLNVLKLVSQCPHVSLSHNLIFFDDKLKVSCINAAPLFSEIVFAT